MMFWWRFGLQDILRHKRFALFFIINLALGLIGFILIHSLSASLDKHLHGNLREILTADLMVYSSKPLSPTERESLNQALAGIGERSSRVALYTMLKTGDTSRLVRIIAMDEHFPLYGDFVYDDGSEHPQVARAMQAAPLLTLSGETAANMHLSPGDTVDIGTLSFTVGPLFSSAPGTDFTTIELAPSIYIGLGRLQQSGLIRFGSRVAYQEYIRLKPDVPVKQLVAELKRSFDALAGGDSPIRIVTINDVNRQLGRLAGFFFGYVGLVGVVALYLAGIAAAYLFRGYFHSRIDEIAILMSLGAKRGRCVLLYLIQLTLLGLASAVTAIGAALAVLPFIPSLPGVSLPQDIELAVTMEGILITLAIAITSGFIFCLPVLARLSSIQPLQLLRKERGEAQFRSRLPAYLLSLLPAILFFGLLSTLLTASPARGALFTAGACGVILFFGMFGSLLFTACRILSYRAEGFFKIALRNLYRNRFFSNSVFITIASGVFLMNLIPQIQQGLQEEISQPKGIKLPVFFLMDIQEEQKQPLIDFTMEKGIALSTPSSMVNGRIESVNDIPFKQYRSELKGRTQRRIRRTEFIFSSRPRLDSSETIIEGRAMSSTPWSPASGEPFELSVADHFRKRFALHLGDRLTFNIQGIRLQGKVVNFRKVRWNSFQPNFFLLFQPGVLDLAPKTYLASVSGVDPSVKQKVKNELVDNFPNISVLDVTQTVETLLGFSEKLVFAIRSMAMLAIAAGLTAVFSIARNEAGQHEREVNLLKVLGAGFSTIRLLTVLEFGFLAAMASLFSTVLSIFCSFLLSWYFFDRLWKLELTTPLGIIAGTLLVCLLTALLATNKVIRKKPVALLNG